MSERMQLQQAHSARIVFLSGITISADVNEWMDEWMNNRNTMEEEWSSIDTSPGFLRVLEVANALKWDELRQVQVKLRDDHEVVAEEEEEEQEVGIERGGRDGGCR